MNTIDTWSVSRLAVFEKCPYEAYLSYVKKIKAPEQPPDSPANRGIRIHTEAENFVNGTGPLTPSLKKFEAKFNELRELYISDQVSLEGNWGYDQEWSPVDWWADNVWGRIKLDAFVNLGNGLGKVIDHKTGKSFGNEVKHAQQGQIYTVGAFMRYPELEAISVEFWYLDEKPRDRARTITRDQAMLFLPKIDARARAMTTATNFKAKPNIHNCRFCPHRPGVLGTCPEGIDP